MFAMKATNSNATTFHETTLATEAAPADFSVAFPLPTQGCSAQSSVVAQAPAFSPHNAATPSIADTLSPNKKQSAALCTMYGQCADNVTADSSCHVSTRPEHALAVAAPRKPQ